MYCTCIQIIWINLSEKKNLQFEIRRLKGIKTNKSELWNRLTYRVLIYIFEVGMKTLFLKWEISRSKSQFEIFFLKKHPFFLFLRLEAEFFLSPCHARHLQQIHWFKIFCRMFGLVVMLTIPKSSPMSLINKIRCQ